MSASTAVFTIASKNYFHSVSVLMESLQKHQPDWRRFLVLADKVNEDFNPSAQPFQVIEAETLQIPDFRHIAFQYNIPEFNTSLKPWAFEHIFKTDKFERVIYLDPDILVFRPLRELEEKLAEFDIVLTPHNIEHMPEEILPGQKEMLLYGTFNLGFMALRRSDSVMKMLKWWQKRLRQDCRLAVQESIFVDQKWMDLIPGIYSSCLVFRNACYNVMTGNIPTRTIKRDVGGIWRVNGEPMAFYHFCGYSPKHPDRIVYPWHYVYNCISDEIRTLYASYQALLEKAGCRHWIDFPYTYGFFSDGTRIHDGFRAFFYNVLLPSGSIPADPFDAEHGEVLNCLISRYPQTPLIGAAMALFLSLSEDALLYSKIPLRNETDYAEWFISGGARDAGIDKRFIRAQSEELRKFSKGSCGKEEKIGESRVACDDAKTAQYSLYRQLVYANIPLLEAYRRAIADKERYETAYGVLRNKPVFKALRTIKNFLSKPGIRAGQ